MRNPGRRNAHAARAMGLVWSCVPDDDLREEDFALAARIAALPPKAIVAIEQLVSDVDGLPLPAALRMSAYSVAVVRSGAEHREAVRAYRAARKD